MANEQTGEWGSTEPLLGAAQLATALGVPRRWIYTQVEQHDLPGYRLPGGRQLLFRLSAVEAWLERHQTGGWESCAEIPTADGISVDVQEAQTG